MSSFNAISIDEVQTQLGIIIPENLVHFYAEYLCVVCQSDGTKIYNLNEIVERNVTFEVLKYCDMLLIGDDSGGNGYFINYMNPLDDEIYRCELGSLGTTSFKKLGLTIEQLHILGSGSQLQDNSTINQLITIKLMVMPEIGIKGILEIHKMLKLEISATLIAKNIKIEPVILLSNVYSSKYLDICKKINIKYHCLQISDENENTIPIG